MSLNKVVGNYRLECELARGGEGALYSAKDLKSREIVAVKKRHCNNVEELNVALREAILLAKVSSKYVVALRDVFLLEVKHPDLEFSMYELYVIMDFCAGGDLFSVFKAVARHSQTHQRGIDELERHSRLPVMAWAMQIANAVSALHDVGVAHRDLKLENFVLRDDGSVCLIDFGVSAAYGKTGTALASQQRETAGTTFYAAPELHWKKASSRKLDSSSTSTSTSASTSTSSTSTAPRPTSPPLPPPPTTTTAVVEKMPSGESLLVTEKERAFAADCWALGVLLIEITTGHIFAMRSDRLVLGVAASQLPQPAWQSLLDGLLADMLPQTSSLVPLISKLLSPDPVQRFCLKQFVMMSSLAQNFSHLSPTPTSTMTTTTLLSSAMTASSTSLTTVTTLAASSSLSVSARVDKSSSEMKSLDSRVNDWSVEQLTQWLRARPNFREHILDVLLKIAATDGPSIMSLKTADLMVLDYDDAALVREIRRDLQKLDRARQ